MNRFFSLVTLSFLSYGAFAGTMGEACAKHDVLTPNYCKGGFFGGVWGIAARQTNFEDYLNNSSYRFNNGSLQAKVGYLFPNSGNDFVVTYTSFKRKGGSNNVAPIDLASPSTLTLPALGVQASLDSVFSGTIPAGQVIPIPAINTTSATIYNNGARNQSLDFDLGQHALIKKLDIRWFGGLRLSRINNNTQFAYSGVSLPGTASITVVNVPDVALLNTFTIDFATAAQGSESLAINQKFEGIGPHIGISADYPLFGGFGIAGTLGSSLLVGKKRMNILSLSANSVTASVTNVTAILDQVPASDPAVTSPIGPITTASSASTYLKRSITSVIPNFDAKVGLNYSHAFSTTGLVTVEGGYIINYYRGAFNSLTSTRSIPEAIGFDGPYVGAQLSF